MEIFNSEKLNSPCALIPAAGFGTRMGSPPAKELLHHPYFKNKNFLEICLESCQKLSVSPLVISRKDKTELNDFLSQNNIPFTLINQSLDWQDSILQSEFLWQEENLVLLPDTYFTPLSQVQKTLMKLKDVSLSFTYFKVSDSKNWGGIKFDSKEVLIVEKKTGFNYAWGHLAFKKEIGSKLFKHLLHDKEFKFHGLFSAQMIDTFIDLTRPISDI
jgi:bifunctional N-acetylglucosamine-1-phosphate-uridyltransferase/glucosamine-1-phosphate-acetyltransferase GlmU-like protein